MLSVPECMYVCQACLKIEAAFLISVVQIFEIFDRVKNFLFDLIKTNPTIQNF